MEQKPTPSGFFELPLDPLAGVPGSKVSSAEPKVSSAEPKVSSAEVVRRCEALADEIDFNDDVAKYPKFFQYPNVRQWMTEANGKYYRMLAAYVKAFRPERVGEVGTRHGASALALAKFTPDVTTYDIDLSALADKDDLYRAGVDAVLLPSPDACTRIDFKDFDFLFVDIGSHDGRYERAIHDRLVRENWKGVVFYDDVNWPGMRPFWDSVTADKAETDWHGDSGFGLIVYPGPEAPRA